ncbi:MAG TPA: Rnf-Nqr domain containing protein [Oscillospiraceae bacterium]|jgi:electron transport complex protein RnfE|nr:Rnf-Nqr domain containing protein [Oscillospiraceae bacterium]
MAKSQSKKKIKIDMSIFDGIYQKNPVFTSGLVIAPAVAAAITVKNAVALIFAFSLISFFAVIISSFVPRDIVYAVRIILYTFIAALVYVPVALFTKYVFPSEFSALGIFIPLLVVNSFITSKTELRFFRKTKKDMLVDVIMHILGFDLSVLIFSFLREIFCFGALGDRILGIPITFPILALPFGGFIFLGLLSALFRKIQLIVRRNN